jgi:hypothetical protein
MGDQIFVRDLSTNLTQLVSANIAGTTGGNGASSEPVISGNGNVVAFISAANNLESLSAGNNDMYPNVFARNLTTGVTYLVSVNNAGNGTANDECYDPQISADGRVVAYSTQATNIDPRDTDYETDVMARDIVAGITYFVSDDTSSAGSNTNYDCYHPTISSDGKIVSFTTEVNTEDVLVHNLLSDVTQLVSLNTAGRGYNGSDNGSINADGSVVAFASDANDLVQRDFNASSDAFVAAISWSTPSLLGDYDGDGVVDAADYTVWRDTKGQSVAAYTGADGSGNGVVDQVDYDVWVAHFGQTVPAASAGSGSFVSEHQSPADPAARYSAGDRNAELSVASAQTDLPAEPATGMLAIAAPSVDRMSNHAPAVLTPLRMAHGLYDEALLTWLALRTDGQSRRDAFGHKGMHEDQSADESTEVRCDAVDEVFGALAVGV